MTARRLLTVAHSYAVAQNRRLAHELARSGKERWEVVAVTPEVFHGQRDLRSVRFEPSTTEPCRVETVPALGTRSPHLFFYGRKLKTILKDHWDAVHCWEEPFVHAGYQIARWTPPRAALVVATFQNIAKAYPPPFCWMEASVMRRSAGWIAFGHSAAKALGGRPAYRERPMRVIPPGVDMDVFCPDRSSGARVRESLGWTVDGPPVAGFLGRFVPEKGVEFLTRTLDALPTPWRALFVGAGPLEAHLRAWATGKRDNVRICTGVSHAAVPGFLNALDVLCAPSLSTPRWREQFGRMLVEAFACGVPVIANRSGEIPYVVGDDGVLLPENDLGAWTQALNEMLENETRRREFAERGHARAQAEFAWAVVARQHWDFFETLLERKGGSA